MLSINLVSVATIFLVLAAPLLAESSQTSDEYADSEQFQLDLEPLRAFCRDLRDEHYPYLSKKHVSSYEVEILRDAHHLGRHLEEVETEHLKKSHKHFSCPEAKDVLSHSSSNMFFSHYKQFVEGTLEGLQLSNNEIITKLLKLRQGFEETGVVNEEVLREVDDIVSDLRQLHTWYDQMAAASKVMEEPTTSEEECQKAFHKLISVLHEMSLDQIPPWNYVTEGVKSLIEQCVEDENNLLDKAEL